MISLTDHHPWWGGNEVVILYTVKFTAQLLSGLYFEPINLLARSSTTTLLLDSQASQHPIERMANTRYPWNKLDKKNTSVWEIQRCTNHSPVGTVHDANDAAACQPSVASHHPLFSDQCWIHWTYDGVKNSNNLGLSLASSLLGGFWGRHGPAAIRFLVSYSVDCTSWLELPLAEFPGPSLPRIPWILPGQWGWMNREPSFVSGTSLIISRNGSGNVSLNRWWKPICGGEFPNHRIAVLSGHPTCFDITLVA